MTTGLDYFISRSFDSTIQKGCVKRWFRHQMASDELLKCPFPPEKIAIVSWSMQVVGCQFSEALSEYWAQTKQKAQEVLHFVTFLAGRGFATPVKSVTHHDKSVKRWSLFSIGLLQYCTLHFSPCKFRYMMVRYHTFSAGRLFSMRRDGCGRIKLSSQKC